MIRSFVVTVILIAIIVSLSLGQASANEETAKYLSGQTQGGKYELIPFPLSFAPEIKLDGVEELFFAPGMYQAGNENFFSYVFIWQFDSEKLLSKAELKQYMLAYYQGLYNAVANTKTSANESVMLEGSEASGSGTINWVEPFVTKQKQQLSFNYHQKLCSKQKQVQVFMRVSPQPKSHEIWQKMVAITAKGCS